MRRIRNNNSENTFEQGISQIVREKVAQPTRYADYELDAIQRREEFEANQVPQRTPGRGYNIIDLMQELAWNAPFSATRAQ